MTALRPYGALLGLLLKEQVVQFVSGNTKSLQNLIARQRGFRDRLIFSCIAANDDYKLAQRFNLVSDFRQLTEVKLFVQLCELASEAGFTIAENVQEIEQRFLNSMRGLVKDQTG